MVNYPYSLDPILAGNLLLCCSAWGFLLAFVYVLNAITRRLLNRLAAAPKSFLEIVRLPDPGKVGNKIQQAVPPVEFYFLASFDEIQLEKQRAV